MSQVAATVCSAVETAMGAFRTVFKYAEELTSPELNGAVMKAASCATDFVEWLHPNACGVLYKTISQRSTERWPIRSVAESFTYFLSLPAHLHMRHAVQPLVSLFTNTVARYAEFATSARLSGSQTPSFSQTENHAQVYKQAMQQAYVQILISIQEALFNQDGMRLYPQ